MSRHRGATAKLIFSLFVMLAIYISGLFGPKNHTRAFIALTTLAWHILANVYCAWISSYRFENPNAKYIRIKNKFIRKIFVRPCSVGKIEFAGKSDDRINIIGFVLNIINVSLFVLFEILLFIPSIPCKTYLFTFVVGSRPRNYEHLDFELHSLNEIIPAEGSRIFAVATAIIMLVFVGLVEHQVEVRRKNIEKARQKTPRKSPFKETEWHYPLYMALIDISAYQNNKKHKYWYDIEQLEQIESLVKTASKNAELKLETKGNKIVSFTVVDTLNNSIRFTGYFL